MIKERPQLQFKPKVKGGDLFYILLVNLVFVFVGFVVYNEHRPNSDWVYFALGGLSIFMTIMILRGILFAMIQIYEDKICFIYFNKPTCFSKSQIQKISKKSSTESSGRIFITKIEWHLIDKSGHTIFIIPHIFMDMNKFKQYLIKENFLEKEEV